MVLMATLTHQSTDCLGGRLHRDAFRRYPSRGAGAPRATATSDSKHTRPAANGRQRGRKPRHAAATVQPQKRALENVVILKRGEQVEPKSETTVTPAMATPVARAESAESVAAAGQLGAQQALSDTAAAADQCGEPSEKAETAVAEDRCTAPTEKGETASATKVEAETVEAEKAPAAKTEAETVASADRCSVQARKTEAVAGADLCTAPVKTVAAANRTGPKARKAEAGATVYSGASFVVSPDPRQLPIPVAFVKVRRAHTAACA